MFGHGNRHGLAFIWLQVAAKAVCEVVITRMRLFYAVPYYRN